MSGITNKAKAKAIKKKNDRKKVLDMETVQTEVSADFHKMLDDFHRMNVGDDYKLDTQFYQWKVEEITDGRDNLRGTWDESLPTFSPSSAYASDRDLVFKIIEAEEDEQPFFPYQKRWVRNGSAIHDAHNETYFTLRNI